MIGPARDTSDALPDSADVVVIGSGLGGLCTAALLAVCHNRSVVVLEAHAHPGGAAHAWPHRGYTFDSGPHLFSGLADGLYAPSATSGRRGAGAAAMSAATTTTAWANPLRAVLDAVGATVPVVSYDAWDLHVPEGRFNARVGSGGGGLFTELMDAAGGPGAAAEVAALTAALAPLGRLATAIPPAAVRPGDAVASARGAARFLSPATAAGLAAPWNAAALTGPFGRLLDNHVTDPFARRFLDLVCFLLAGVPAAGILTAEVAFLFAEWERAAAAANAGAVDGALDFPIGGAAAIVDALVDAIRRSGRGRLVLSAPVSSIVVEGGVATGVVLADGRTVRAMGAVVSNAAADVTAGLLSGDTPAAAAFHSARVASLDPLPSFLHLHLGVPAVDGEPPPPLNAAVVRSWTAGVDAPQNVALLSIPSVVEPGVAPAGCHAVHAYAPATEPWELWAPWAGRAADRRDPAYAALKAERSAFLFDAVERVWPGAADRATVRLVGSPVTHARYLRRPTGSYGPAVVAQGLMGGVRSGGGALPLPLPGGGGVDRLVCVGDSIFPGIGVPAVAASGWMGANAVVEAAEHLALLDRLQW
ncbi:hypothetical protein MMPV_008499 [Pyropia vietnamensis]